MRFARVLKTRPRLVFGIIILLALGSVLLMQLRAEPRQAAPKAPQLPPPVTEKSKVAASPSLSYDPRAFAAFTYAGKPVPPACVLSAWLNGPQPLATCGRNTADETWDPPAFKNGLVFSVGSYLLGTPYPMNQYDGYSVLAQKGNVFLLYNQWNGGGTGDFSNILRVQLSSSTLTSAGSLSGEGDRCNGGVSVDAVRGGVVYYSVELTPPDIIDLGASTTLQAYRDLEASAQSCYGEAHYHYSLEQGSSSLDSVTLNAMSGNDSGDVPTDGDLVTSYTYQPCFNGVYNRYVDAGHSELRNMAQIKQFAHDFLSTCVPQR